MRTKSLVLGLAFVAAGGLGYVAGAKTAPKAGVMWAAAEEKWEPLGPGMPLEIVKLYGDRSKGEYGMLLKLPANTPSLGWHAHTADYHAVVVQGTWVHTFEGGQPKEMGPGSYAMQPGKQMHDDGCKGAQDCIVFVSQKAKGDFIPKKADAPAPAPQ